MARTKQTARKSTQGKAPRPNFAHQQQTARTDRDFDDLDLGNVVAEDELEDVEEEEEDAEAVTEQGEVKAQANEENKDEIEEKTGAAEVKAEPPPFVMDPDLLLVYQMAKDEGDEESVRQFEEMMAKQGVDLTGKSSTEASESKQQTAKAKTSPPRACAVFDFRHAKLPDDVEIEGGEVVLEKQRDGSTCICLPPVCPLKLGVNLTPLHGVKVNDYTITMDIMLEKLPTSSMALYQSCSNPSKNTEGDAFVYPNGGVGVFGEMGIEEASLRPKKWTRIVVTVGPSVTLPGERLMTTYVNGKKCATVSSNKRGVLNNIDGRFGLNPEFIMLFASTEEESMPGCKLKFVEVKAGCISEEQVKEESFKNRIFSSYESERKRELEALHRQLTLQPLYKKPPPVWLHPTVLAEFGDPFLESTGLEGGNLGTASAAYALTLQRMLREVGPAYLTHLAHEQMQAVNALASIMNDFKELTRKYALGSRSGSQLVNFIKRFLKSLQVMREGECILAPGTFNGGTFVYILEKENEDSYRFTIVNTDPYAGLDWHLASTHSPPKIKYKTCLSLSNISREKMLDESMWLMLFKLSVYGGEVPGDYSALYDWILPFLLDKPLEAILGDIQDDAFVDWRSPQRSSTAYMRTLLEATHYILRRRGLTCDQAKLVAFAIRAQMIAFIDHDLNFIARLSDSDRKVVRMACEQLTYSAVKLGNKGLLTPEQLNEAYNSVTLIQRLVDQKPPSEYVRGKVNLQMDDGINSLSEHVEHPFFDRLLRLDDVDGLAGPPLVRPRYVPVDALLIPVRVNNLEDAVAAIRYCDKLCTLVRVQTHCVKNRQHMVVSLIEHTFTKVVPVPKPPIASDYDQCVWRTGMRYALQLDIVLLLQRIIEHFVAAVFGLHPTRTLDGIKLVIPACIAAIADVTMRKVATDIPSELCLKLANFGLSIGHFDTQSETIEIHYPELHIARTAVLDYFSTQTHLEKKIFCWEQGHGLEATLVEFLSSVCNEVAFPYAAESYMTTVNALIMKNYPEFRCYRDIAFYFKYFQNTDPAAFPGKAEYEQIHAELTFQWDASNHMFIVVGFGGGVYLQCVPRPPLTFTHRYPSSATPSFLTNPHEVNTEDDVLHIKNLPSFDDCLGQQDAELMISYLTVPYIRIPLVLTFFSTEDRIHALKSEQLQNVLDSVLFEPGRYLSYDMTVEPKYVPAENPNLLATAYGLLINELHRSPDVVLDALTRLLKLALDLDTGTIHSTTVPIILYVLRLASRVENYITFLVLHTRGEHESINVDLRDTHVFPEILEKLEAGQRKIRGLLRGPVHRMLEAWYAEAMKECENKIDDAVLDENSRLACKLLAHLLLIYRNISVAEMNSDICATLTSAFIFLTTRHSWNLDLLSVPECEVFEVLCVTRRRIIVWLRQQTQQELNNVMEAIVRMAAGTGLRKADQEMAMDSNRLWAFIEGPRSVGRFTVANVRRQGIDGGFRAIQEVDNNLELGVEIDLQIIQLTLKSAHMQALDTSIAANVDVQLVFGSKSMQASHVESTVNREWVHLIGRNHDIHYWKTPDPRPALQELDRDYAPGELELTEEWIVPIFEPVRLSYMVEPFVLQICLPENALPGDAEVAYMVGIHPKNGGTWKEIFVFKTLGVVHVYNVLSHGRRFYRSLEYTTNAMYTLRDMQPSCGNRNSPWPVWARYETGHPYAAWPDPTSCVITRGWDFAQNLSGGTETLLPERLLFGIVPTSLLQIYRFWQDEDDNLRGYPIDDKHPYMIEARLKNVKMLSSTMLEGTCALIKRTLCKTQENRTKELNVMFSHVDGSGLVSGEYEVNFELFKSLGALYDNGWRGSNVERAITALKTNSASFESMDALLHAISQQADCLDRTIATKPTRTKSLDEEDLILVDLLYAKKGSKLYSMAETLARIETLAFVLAWTKDATYAPGLGKETLSLDLVELPRIKLSFHSRKDETGITRLYSLDHSHLFVSNYSSPLTEMLTKGIPHSLILSTSNNELQVLVPSIDPHRPFIGSAPFSTELVLDRSNGEWYSVLDTNYYLYPVHVSLSFLFSPTLSSALYLLLLKFLNRSYVAVFRLANSIGTDTEFSPEEEKIFSTMARIPDAHPDAHACRLKISLVVIDSPVTLPWDVTKQMSRYVTKLSHVSSTCRLTFQEEMQLLTICITEFSDPRYDPRIYTEYEIILNKNRKYYLQALLTDQTEADQFLVARKLGTDWINKRDMTALEADESAWTGIQVNYAAARSMSGVSILDESHKLWCRPREDMLGNRVAFGFLFLYELFTGTKPLKLFKSETKAHSLAFLLLQQYADKDASGLMPSVLNFLAFNPHLCEHMPKYKDTRKYKNQIVKGAADENEDHSPIAILFMQLLPAMMERIDEMTPLPDTSVYIPVRPPSAKCDVIPVGRRDWVIPAVTDFGCSDRMLEQVSEDVSKDLVMNQEELAFLCSSPLDVVDMSIYVCMEKRSDLKLPMVNEVLPFDVSEHDQAKSAVALSMIERLQHDMQYFADQTNQGLVPKLTFLSDSIVHSSLVTAQLTAIGAKAFATKTLNDSEEMLSALISQLESLRERDTIYVTNALPWIEDCANKVQLRTPQGIHVDGLLYCMRRFCGQEVTLWTEFLFSSVLSSLQIEDLQLLNPYLETDAIRKLTNVMVATIFHANRVGHINRCVSDARDLQKLLASVCAKSVVIQTPEGPSVSLSNELEASIILKAESMARNLNMKRYFVAPRTEDSRGVAADSIDVAAVFDSAQKGCALFYDPRFLLFEFTWNIMLRESQVILIREFMDSIRKGKSLVKQMIMGAGKTTVVGPLLTLMLGDGKSLVMQVVPPALLEFSRSIMRSTFSSIMHKRIYTLYFDRASEPNSKIFSKLNNAIKTMGVVISTPTSVKSVMLKFVEVVDTIRDSTRPRHPDMERDARELSRILKLFKEGILIMDEVDLILHPMKSELNFPIGAKHDLDFSPQRWQLPIHILDSIFYVERQRMSVNFRQSTRAMQILLELEEAIQEGYKLRALQRNPHIVLLNPEWYHEVMKPIIAQWTYLWLESQHLSGISAEDIEKYILEGANVFKNPELALRVEQNLTNDNKKMINLAHDWLRSYLPHCLQKIDRVSFGIMNKEDYERAIKTDPHMPRTRAKLAIPFVGKDVPSRSSEFAHPDVIIGLTVLAYRYEGLRWTDFEDIISNLRSTLTKEMGPWDKRKSSLRYARWVKESGGRIKGQPRYRDEDEENKLLNDINGQTPMDVEIKKIDDEEDYDDEKEVVSLRLLKRSNEDQMKKIFDLLRSLPDVIHWYLENFIFPAYMRNQIVKLSACGQEVGGDMLFTRRIGFSGTPSDLLPIELGRCGYEKGSDGQMIHVMTSPDIVSYEIVAEGWTAHSLLERIASAEEPRFNALIDTGALITGMTNFEVARFLLDHGLPWCEGIVFLDEYDRKMILVKATGRVLKMAQCGIPANKRFAFYDQVHTTGMDIQHMLNAKAVLTLGKDMTFRDYAQGAYRMRGIAKGQTIHLFIIPEVQQLMVRELSKARLNPDPKTTIDTTGAAEFKSSTAMEVVAPEGCVFSFHLPQSVVKSVLVDVVAWLVVNSMRSERVQFNQLCLQNVGNVWRKNAFKTVLEGSIRFKVTLSANEMDRFLMQALDVFCEPIDFSLEAGVPEPVMFAETIRRRVEKNREFILLDDERKVIDDVVRLVSGSMLDEADRVLSAEMVQEQEEEKEKQQEQEQEQEIEIEKYVDLAYSRENEEPKKWLFESLGTYDTPQFYKAQEFKLYKRRPLNFPEYMDVSDNYFDKRWSGARRIKNVVMLLEWIVDPAQLKTCTRTYEPLSSTQEQALETAIDLFDQRNCQVLDLESLKLVLKSAAHLKPSDEELISLIAEIVRQPLPRPSLHHSELKSLLSSGRFSPFENGRRFVCTSLAEAETIRRIMHMRLGSKVIDLKNSTLALRCVPAGNVITDRTLGYEEASTAYMTSAAHQSFRFLNCDMFFSEENLNVLLRALHNTTRRERRHFFRYVIGCRRRLASKWEETPVAKIFSLPDQFSMLKQRAYAVRVREAIKANGMLLYDAFNKFDADKNGFLSPPEVWGAFEYLNIRSTTAQDIVQFVRTADTDRDGNISYKEFIEILQDPDTVDKDEEIDSEENEVAENTPGMQRQVSLTPVEPRGETELKRVQEQLALDEQREEEEATRLESLEEDRITQEMEMEEDEKDRTQEGGRNPKVIGNTIRYDFSTGRRPRKIATRGDIKYQQDDLHRQFLRVFPPTVLFLEIPFEGNCGGARLNQYTVSMEVMFDPLPQPGEMAALFSTAKYNESAALVWVSPEGSLGKDSVFGLPGTPRLVAKKWHYVTVVVDCVEGNMHIYVDGAVCAIVPMQAQYTFGADGLPDITFDGTFSCGDTVCLFASKAPASCLGGNIRQFVLAAECLQQSDVQEVIQNLKQEIEGDVFPIIFNKLNEFFGATMDMDFLSYAARNSTGATIEERFANAVSLITDGNM